MIWFIHNEYSSSLHYGLFHHSIGVLQNFCVTFQMRSSTILWRNRRYTLLGDWLRKSKILVACNVRISVTTPILCTNNSCRMRFLWQIYVLRFRKVTFLCTPDCAFGKLTSCVTYNCMYQSFLAAKYDLSALHGHVIWEISNGLCVHVDEEKNRKGARSVKSMWLIAWRPIHILIVCVFCAIPQIKSYEDGVLRRNFQRILTIYHWTRAHEPRWRQTKLSCCQWPNTKYCRCLLILLRWIAVS